MRALVLAVLLAVASGTGGCSCGGVHLPADAGSDVLVPFGPDLDPRGEWGTCVSSWTFGDGTLEVRDHRRGCVATAAWTADGATLSVAWDAGCEGGPGDVTYDGARSPGVLLLVDRATGDLVTLAAAGGEVRSYTLVDDVDPSRRTVVRLVGEPGVGAGDGCYWSEDGACGGLLSCSGYVEQWPDDPGEVVASTSCRGDCPCASILHVTPNADGTLAVAYDGVDCGHRTMGTATATPRPE